MFVQVHISVVNLNVNHIYKNFIIIVIKKLSYPECMKKGYEKFVTQNKMHKRYIFKGQFFFKFSKF